MQQTAAPWRVKFTDLQSPPSTFKRETTNLQTFKTRLEYRSFVTTTRTRSPSGMVNIQIQIYKYTNTACQKQLRQSNGPLHPFYPPHLFFTTTPSRPKMQQIQKNAEGRFPTLLDNGPQKTSKCACSLVRYYHIITKKVSVYNMTYNMI